MVKSPATNISKTRPKPRKRREGPVTYDIRIEAWEWSYSFGVSHRPQQGKDPYEDFRHLHLNGTLIRPTHIKSKKVTVMLLPDAALDPERRSRNTPTAIGSISAGRGEIGILLSIPADALTNILIMLTADKFQFVSLEGTKLHYGQGMITYLRLDMTDADPD